MQAQLFSVHVSEVYMSTGPSSDLYYSSFVRPDTFLDLRGFRFCIKYIRTSYEDLNWNSENNIQFSYVL